MNMVPLGTTAQVIAGQSPDGSAYNASGHGLPFYQGKKEFGDRCLGAPSTWTTEVTKEAQEGDILMSVRAPVGPVNLATQRICIGRGLAAIRSSDCLNRDFLFYQLIYKRPEISGREGAVFASISKSDIEAIKVWLPSLGEQRRIVAVLDEAFEGIATAKAHAERNLRNARATFESILEAVYTDRVGEAPKKRLEALCEHSRLITYGVIKLGDPIEGGVPCLRTSNVRWLSIDTNGMKRIAPSLSAEYSRTVLRGGEVLVNVRGTLGGVAVAPDFMAGWNVSREVAVVPINPVTLDPEYAAFWIGSRASQDWLSGVKKGAAYTGINIEDLRNLPVPVTSQDAQSQIVHDLKAARSATLQIETIYSRKLAALDELKQSLLHQAFSGAL